SVVLEAYRAIPSKKHKLAIIFTDGEDFSKNLAAVRAQAVQEKLSIFAVGVGTERGEPIPLLDAKGNLSGHQKDTKGKVVISRLDSGLLENICKQVGGYYVGMTSDESDIKTIADRVKTFERERFQEANVQDKVERYWPFV